MDGCCSFQHDGPLTSTNRYVKSLIEEIMKMIMPLLKHSEGWGYQYQPAIPRAHCTIPKVMIKVRLGLLRLGLG